jgi:hypothetical protein
MGPRNVFDVIDVSRTLLAYGVRRVEVTYPDGVETELRLGLPAAPEALAVIMANIPQGSHMISNHSDTDDDGNVFSYASYWVPQPIRCTTCLHHIRSNTHACKLVEA